MDEIDEDELFTICLDDDGHPVQRAVRDMTAGEVIAAIDHLTAGSTRLAEREKLARLRQVVRKSTPDRAEAERALHAMRAELFHYARSFPAAFRKHR